MLSTNTKKRGRSPSPPSSAPSPPSSAALKAPAMTARAHGALALAEVAVPELPRPTAPFLVLMLDRSGSMAGTRTSNMLRGVRALLKLLAAHVPDARVALVGFHAAARVVFGAGSPADALGAWAEIELALYPAGGTDLAAALREGLRVALGSEGRAATLLLLTDGQDPSLGAALLSSPRGEEELDFEPALRVSGIALHLVGICSDADAAVLETLGARTGGTFTCIDDTDIQGLMGSLLGLVLDQLPQAARLTITAASGASGASGGAAEKEIVVLLPERAVILRSGATVRVPFELIGAFGVEGADVVTIDMRLRLVRVGTVDETERTFETRVALAASAAAGGGAGGGAVVAAHAQAWYAAAARAVAGLLIAGEFGAARDEVRQVQARLGAIAIAIAEGEGLDGIRAELEALAERITEAAARDEHTLVRELSARVASRASTVRNGGVSLGGGVDESPSQSEMRALSLAF